MNYLLSDVWIRIQDISVVLPLSCSFGESCLFFSWCVGGRCGMVGSDDDRDRNRRFGAEGRGWSYMSDTRWPDDREVGWYYVRSAPYTWRQGASVSWLSLKTKVDGFSRFGLKTGHVGFLALVSKSVVTFSLVWRQNRCWWFFDIKTGDWFFGWVSKPKWLMVSQFRPQNRQLRFGGLNIKITTTVS
jgi:hypothetical protein